MPKAGDLALISQSGAIVSGIVEWAAARGAASALLLAPASGQETRKALVKRARKAYHEGQELMEDTWEDAERAARRAARAGMKRARQQAARLRALGEETVGNGRKRLRVCNCWHNSF